MWIKNNQVFKLHSDIRQACPDISFPEIITNETALSAGFEKVTEVAQPTHNPLTQYIAELAPAQVNGVWTQQWQVLDLLAATIAANLMAARSNKIEQIKAERDRRKEGGTLVANKWFHSDRDSRIQQLGLVIMGAAIPQVQWKTMDGSFITMTQAIAGAIFQATATLDMNLYAVAEGHITAINASNDPTNYDFSTGWPDYYLGV